MISIIIPCLNEAGNIVPLIARLNNILAENKIDAEIIIIDDDSQDGTGEVAIGMQKRYKNLRVIIRRNELGLGTAVAKGFEIANGEILVVMDADLTHPPEAIPYLIEPIRTGNCDLAIGSRYVKGAIIKDFPLIRRLISRVTSMAAKTFVGVDDAFSGFFALKRSVIEDIKLSPKGFKVGFEIIVKGNYKKLVEVPYQFKYRKFGRSKLSVKVMIENTLFFLSLIFSKGHRYEA